MALRDKPITADSMLRGRILVDLDGWWVQPDAEEQVLDSASGAIPGRRSDTHAAMPRWKE